MRREEEIRMIAYSLWVKDGYRRGSAIKHWLEAEAIWENNRKALNKSRSPIELKLDRDKSDTERKLSLINN